MWTDENVSTLKELVELGLSSGQIAKKLGESFTRNSVIGKLRRIGVKLHGAPHRKGELRPRSPRRANGAKHHFGDSPIVSIGLNVAPPPSLVEPTVTTKNRTRLRLCEDMTCTIAELHSRKCKWPMWEFNHSRHEPYLYCGVATARAPYCDQHRAMAGRVYQGPSSTREPSGPLVTQATPVNP